MPGHAGSSTSKTALRQAGYTGPIAVELRNLPAGVTAPKATIPMGEDAVEIEVSAAPNAAVATALNNLQGASPNFTVAVGKK